MIRRRRPHRAPALGYNNDQLARDFAFLTALLEDAGGLAADGQDPSLSPLRQTDLLQSIETKLAAASRLIPKMHRRLAAPQTGGSGRR